MLSNELKLGDHLSETSYYTVEAINATDIILDNNGERVTLSKSYIDKFCNSGEIYHKEVKVTKEDTYWTAKQLTDAPDGTRVGDLKAYGIRSIWESVGNQVFTACFTKLPKKKTKKALEKEMDAQIAACLAAIKKAQKQKKGVLAAAKKELYTLQASPISNTFVEERVLRGYKKEFTSRTGLYKVYDMEAKGERQLNLPTLKWLIVDGVKYIVK